MRCCVGVQYPYIRYNSEIKRNIAGCILGMEVIIIYFIIIIIRNCYFLGTCVATYITYQT